MPCALPHFLQNEILFTASSSHRAFAFHPSLCVEAATTLQIDIQGTFTQETSGGYPDYEIGDVFSFSLTFDDSIVDLSRPDGVTVFSILSSELHINGILTPHLIPGRVGLYENDLGSDFFFDESLGVVGNAVLLNPSMLPFILETFEFSDFLLLDGITFQSSDFTFRNQSSMGVIRGPVTSITVQVVPEPSTVALIAVAGVGLVLGYRRNRSV